MTKELKPTRPLVESRINFVNTKPTAIFADQDYMKLTVGFGIYLLACYVGLSIVRINGEVE